MLQVRGRVAWWSCMSTSGGPDRVRRPRVSYVPLASSEMVLSPYGMAVFAPADRFVATQSCRRKQRNDDGITHPRC